jgi:hypothetical protein
MSLSVIFSSFSSAEIQLVKARLLTAGFHPVVTDEIASLSMDGYSMATGGIRLQVPDTESQQARQLVESLLNDAAPETGEMPSTSE